MVCNKKKKKKKENWFSLNGNGIMSSFLGEQFYRSTLYISFFLLSLWHICRIRFLLLSLTLSLSFSLSLSLTHTHTHTHTHIYIYIEREREIQKIFRQILTRLISIKIYIYIYIFICKYMHIFISICIYIMKFGTLNHWTKSKTSGKPV